MVSFDMLDGEMNSIAISSSLSFFSISLHLGNYSAPLLKIPR